ncbi:glycosyltransferase family 2 protein [Polaribacter sp. WD7]|uniref:glycosyltransferase family 2 protein n=1 Tax=Polaribacter sp. WD7 TaxID=2269061 RepID=UPI0015F11F28|nr:glycosyltransferase family 2 protein [Polaribacter sp. WD7]
MTKDYLFSVIIPHKDSTTLLQRCLDSIPKDDDIQILIIDDNSQNIDRKNFPGNDRAHVKIFFSDIQLTAGGARNKALSMVSGKWILFSDADDFFTSNAFETFRATISNQYNILYYKVESKYSDTLKPATRHLGVNKMINEYEEDANILRLKHIVPWGKVFSAEFIKTGKFKFDEVPASNDMMFGLKTGYYSSQIAVVHHVVYCITMKSGSISNTLTKTNNRSRYQVMLRANLFLREKGLHKYQNSIRPFVFNALKFGVLEFIDSIKLLYKYKGDFFYDFKFGRVVTSFFKLKQKEELHKKYIKKKE